MKKVRKICVITGSRAEYGLLRPLMLEIKKDPAFKLQIIATGMHLSNEFGLTYREIETDGFEIDEKIEILLGSDTSVGVTKSMGLVFQSFAEAYRRLRPDLLVVLGDRFEIFSVVAVALIHKIPVAHLSGGEVTKGAFDDAMRHGITKMSHLHFTTTEAYRKRVIQLGESPNTVFNVGATALDNIFKLKLLSKKQLEKKFKFQFKKCNLLVTFHPITLEKKSSAQYFKMLLKVLSEMKNTGIIFTKANADPEGRVLNAMIDKFVASHSNRMIAFDSMGSLLYLSTMRVVDAIVGNSSSGIVEAPSFKIGTINIGDRQAGRIKASSIIDCDYTEKSIKNAFQTLSSNTFQKSLENITNPYGNGTAAKQIVEIIKKISLGNLIKKEFYDYVC